MYLIKINLLFLFLNIIGILGYYLLWLLYQNFLFFCCILATFKLLKF